MQIAIISPASLPIPNVLGGAIETLVTHILDQNELSDNNIKITVFTQYNELALKESLKYKKIEFVFYHPNIYYKILGRLFDYVYKLFPSYNGVYNSVIFQNRRKLELIKPDLFLVEGEYKQVLPLSKFGIPIVLHLHTDILNSSVGNCSQVAKACTRIWTISEFLKSRVESGGCESSKIDVLKNAIDTSNFVLTRDDNLKRTLGISNKTHVFIYSGRVVPIKGVKELLQAFHMASLDNSVLLVVGGTNFADKHILSDYEKELRSYSKENNLNVVFTGYIPQIELPHYYSIADVAICPSICQEAAGLVVIEALCMGIPVIASRIGGIPEYCSTNTTLVDVDDNFIQNLASAMRNSISNNTNKAKKDEVKEYCSQYNLKTYYNNFIKLLSKI